MNDTSSSFVGPNITAARRFTRHLADLLGKERGDMVTFLLAVAECDGRRMWAELGYASLFEFLHRELALSCSAAYFRAAAAGLVLKYPEVADALTEGRLCLSTVGELGKVITPENVPTILPRFFHLSTREAREVVAELSPRPAPPTREVVMAVPCHREHRGESATLAIEPAQTVLTSGLDATRPVASPDPATPRAAVCDDRRSSPAHVDQRIAAAPNRRDEIEPLTAELRRIHITVSKRWIEKLNAAKAALSHSIPSGDGQEVLEAALDALLEREARRQALLVNKPRRARVENTRDPAPVPAPSSESAPSPAIATASPKRRRKAIPAHVRREVLIRDGGTCQARLHDGTVCGSKLRLQVDHVQPAALGGPSTVESLRVVCERHNQLAARKVFGDAWMDAASGG